MSNIYMTTGNYIYRERMCVWVCVHKVYILVRYEAWDLAGFPSTSYNA